MSDPRTSTSGDLVGRLVADLAPVRPVRSGRMVAIAVALEIAVVLVVAWLFGFHMARPERIFDPAFAGLLGALAAGAVASARTMTMLSVPGRPVSRALRAFVLALPPVLAVAMIVFSPWGGSFHGFAAVVVEGFGCTKNTLLVATPAWLAGLLFLRRLAPLDPLRVGLFSACAALLAAAVVVQMACPSCDSWHLAISHYVPLLVAAWVAAMLSPVVLSLRAPESRS
ncbi:MAG TPA: NrsF family protein [Candidatus Limnocylindrales bacterium]|nr:NrsF family protein [Candidatus Limnocylindrales bacterium]